VVGEVSAGVAAVERVVVGGVAGRDVVVGATLVVGALVVAVVAAGAW
jgi:hypothetical protein